MGGQQMNINLTTTIKEENGMWVATGTMDTPGGQATDVAIVEKGTLIVRKQDIQQGPVNINLQFTDKKATGKMNMNGQDRQVDADLGGPLFGDASASELSLAALPLAEGYSTEFRNFDVRKQKEKLMELTGTGTVNRLHSIPGAPSAMLKARLLFYLVWLTAGGTALARLAPASSRS
jgi:hypothetical protein